MEKQEARQLMERGLKAVIAQAGYLAGLNTVQDCMQDEDMRAFLGNALLKEIMPVLPLPRDQAAAPAMELCKEMENAREESLLALCQRGARGWERDVLPLMQAYLSLEGMIPPCLSFSLACLILYFSGAKRNAQGGFEGLRPGDAYIPEEDEAALSAFARLSPDMPPETLAYAVLSDRDIWEKDLRDVEGLAETIENQIRDLQILGLREAMKRANQ